MANYNLAGPEKGRLVLLLHGWGDSARGLATLQTQLAKKYRVIALDLPGHGGTQAPPEAWGLEDYSRYVAAFLDKLELGQPYAIIGHSNGGALAIKAISLGELQPGKLVLLAAAGIRDRNKIKRFVLKLIAKVGDIATLWMPERYRAALRKSLYGVAGSDQDVVPELKETFRRTVRQDVRADATKIAVPTLLIYGRNDRAVPLADGELYSRVIKDSRLEVLEAEHFVHLEQPAQVYELIEGFLA